MEKLFQINTGCAIQDRRCQKILYEQYYGADLKIAFRYLDTYEQSVEVTNDALAKIFRNLGRFEIRDRGRMEIVMPCKSNLFTAKAYLQKRPASENAAVAACLL